jgi:hypothetical protein
MNYRTDVPWQEPKQPAAHWLWPVNLWAGERHRKALPYRQHRYPDGIRVVCVDLGPAGHADVTLSGQAAWTWLARNEADAHGEQPDRMVELDWLNPPRVAPCLIPMFALPDGAGYLTVAQEWLAHH